MGVVRSLPTEDYLDIECKIAYQRVQAPSRQTYVSMSIMLVPLHLVRDEQTESYGVPPRLSTLIPLRGPSNQFCQ